MMQESTDFLEFNKNSFDIIRYFAAFQVIYGHGVAHFHLNDFIWPFLKYFSGVSIFFGISGFLVTASFERSKAIKSYLVKRFLRIYPELFVCFIVSTICIVIFYDIKPNYKDIIIYITTQLTFFQFYTGVWLKGYGIGAPNGSLWTIPVLIQFYILTIPLYRFMKNKKIVFWILLLIISILLSIIYEFTAPVMPSWLSKLIFVSFLPYIYMRYDFISF
jgi:peptidoglycan/LPS O-acetylase OafA/YrhL